MDKIKLVILTAIPFWHPGTGELIDRLRKQGFDVIALDIFHGKLYNSNNEIVNLIPGKLTGIAARIYMKLFRNYFTRKHTSHCDILDLHFIEPEYAKHIPQLKKPTICSLFGSDLYRTSDEQKQVQKHLFESCDRIVLSQNMVPFFEQHFGDQSKKYMFNQYGSIRLDVINDMLDNFDSKVTREHFGVPEDKIVVTCGYNGKAEQQHVKIAESIAALNDIHKEQLYLILPMTYGGSESYFQKVKIAYQKTGVPFKMIHNRLNDEELAKLRLISDITLNTQTTDALASSIKEALISGDIMLVGDWLPYDIYKELGVEYKTVNFNSLTTNIQTTIDNLSAFKEAAKKNREIILRFASWNSLIETWATNYKTLYNESKR